MWGSEIFAPARLQILGHGLAGALLAEQAAKAGYEVKVYDEGPPAASRVAAGLFTPVTGQRLALGWEVEQALPRCLDSYSTLERELGIRFFHPLPTLRIFSSAEQRQNWMQKPCPDCVRAIPPPDLPLHMPHGALEIHGGGWVDLPLLLDTLEQRRKTRNEWGRHTAPQRTVHCTGFSTYAHPYWREAGWRNARGDVLTLRIPGLPAGHIYSFDKFLLPLGGGLFRLGATYEWDCNEPIPRPAGRAELEEALRARTELPYEVLEHRAGVRPVAPARVPIVGPHPDHPDEWIFNGFGSKGVLYAPWLAERLLANWQTGEELPKETQAPRRILRQRKHLAEYTP